MSSDDASDDDLPIVAQLLAAEERNKALPLGIHYRRS